MKKVSYIVIIFALIFSTISCKKGNNNQNGGSSNGSSTTQSSENPHELDKAFFKKYYTVNLQKF